MANEKTTNYEWTIEEEYADPYYAQAKTIRNEIDATVYGIDQRVVNVEADSLNAEYLWEQPIDEILDGETDKTVGDIVYPVNKAPFSEDFTSWTNVRCTFDMSTGDDSPLIDRGTGVPVEYSGLIGDSGASASHYFRQDITLSLSGRCYVKGYAKAGNNDFIQVYNATTNERVFLNIASGAVGTITNNAVAYLNNTGNGVRWMVEMDCVSGTNNILILSAESDGVQEYVGDGSTIDTYITGIEAGEGTVQSNVDGYAKTAASIIDGPTEIRVVDNHDAYHRGGFVRKLDGTWIPASSVDGDLMDGSAGNVAVLHDAGMLQNYATGAFETPQISVTDGTDGEHYEYYTGRTVRGSKELYRRYNETGFGLGTVDLDTRSDVENVVMIDVEGSILYSLDATPDRVLNNTNFYKYKGTSNWKLRLASLPTGASDEWDVGLFYIRP